MATLLALPGSLVPRAHTACSALAFITALLLGYVSGLWEQLCENSVSKWPVEWFPSVSATIGDHAATRAPFQILIALTATPRFIVLGLQWLAHRYPPSKSGRDASITDISTSALSDNGVRRRTRSSKESGLLEEHTAPAAALARPGLVDIEAFCGVARTFCCGGWMYITSRDQHDLHDLFMIVYLILNLPWMILSTMLSTNERSKRWRMVCASGFLATLAPLIYWFYQHSVLRVPGAYTYYAFFEWSLVIWDVAFDAAAIFELGRLQIRIIDTSRAEDGKTGFADNVFIAPTAASHRPAVEVDWTAFESLPSKLPYRDVLAWLSDVWFAAAFWTIFTSISVQLFYWSVWSLAFTGSELALFIHLAPYVFNRPGYRAYATSREGIFTHRVLLFVLGLGCYKVPSTGARYICVVLAMWCGWCAFMGDSVRLRGSPEMLAQTKIYLTGLLLTVVCKYAAYSNNPFWPILDEASGGWNKTGLLISALAIAELYYRPNSLFAAPPAGFKDKPLAVVTPSTRNQRLCIVFGLGSIVHLLQTFITDAGTIIAWSWTGYPLTGPTLHPWASVVVGAAALGLVINLPLRNPLTWIIPFPAAMVLVLFQDWVGFFGGLVLIFYIVAITPTVFCAASALDPSTWGHALAWNNFLDVASTFTVAYAFVPFGWILRERTDLIMLILLVPLPAALWAATKLDLPGNDQLQPRSVRRVRLVNKGTKILTAILAFSAVIIGLERRSVSAEARKPTPFYPNDKVFSGGIFTVHFGIDEPGRCSQRRIAQLVQEMEVDVLGMLETDLHRFVYGNRDLTRYMAEELGYYVDLGPGPNQHTWGAALLSKFPILNSTHHLLPSPHGELAPAIHATLDIHGQHVNVIVSHNGQEEDPLDRELQTKELARLLQETGDTPTFFLGYLVTKQGDKPPSPYGILFNEQTGLIDVETLDKWRWCEYVGFRGLWRVAYSRLEHSDVTDTELQVIKFILPDEGQKAVYNDHGEIYWHVGEDDIPEAWKMPKQFRGDGLRGHSYRVWDGPLYYNPPIRSGHRV